MNVGKARAQMSDKNNKDRVTFKDVAGLEEAKVEIMEIVDFLRKADKYKALAIVKHLQIFVILSQQTMQLSIQIIIILLRHKIFR